MHGVQIVKRDSQLHFITYLFIIIHNLKEKGFKDSRFKGSSVKVEIAIDS